MKSRDFVHLLGCGWVYLKGEDRHTPSSILEQKGIIKHCLNAAQKEAGNTNPVTDAQVEAFAKHLLEELDNRNPTP